MGGANTLGLGAVEGIGAPSCVPPVRGQAAESGGNFGEGNLPGRPCLGEGRIRRRRRFLKVNHNLGRRDARMTAKRREKAREGGLGDWVGLGITGNANNKGL